MLRADPERARDEDFKEELAEYCSRGGVSIGKTRAYEMFLQWEREIERLAKDRQKVKPSKGEKPGFIDK